MIIQVFALLRYSDNNLTSRVDGFIGGWEDIGGSRIAGQNRPDRSDKQL